MIRRALATLVLIASLASPAAACDWGECWSWWEEPIQELDWWWPEPVWEPEPVPQPAVVVPEGLYLVTEVYVADVVSVSGPLTTYSTATASETPGTYARVVDSVGTGGVSAYDGSAFNGRAALGDGRSVAGTYYENFVLSGDGFVPVSVVFFQDDSALAPPPPPPPPAPPVAPPPPVVVIPAAPPLPTPAAAVARVDPIVEPPLSAPAPPAAPPPPPPPTSAAILPPAAPRVPAIRPGVSLTPGGESRSEIEVLRGRAIPLWIGATVDGVNRPAATWRVGSGDHVALGASSGGGSEAFRARWDVVTPSGSAWRVGIEATAMVDGIAQVSFAEISVIVRSPALVR